MADASGTRVYPENMRTASWVLGCLIIIGMLFAFVWPVVRLSNDEAALRTRSKDDVRSLLTMAIARGRSHADGERSTGKAFVLKLVPAAERGRFQDLAQYAGPASLDPEPDAKGPTPLIGRLSCDDGAVVGYSDGSVRFLDREELGLGPDDPIVAGPRSRSPILRRLSTD